MSNNPFQLVTELAAGDQFTVKPIASPVRVPANAPVTGLGPLLTALEYVPLNTVPLKLVIVMVEPSSFSQTPNKLSAAAFRDVE